MSSSSLSTYLAHSLRREQGLGSEFHPQRSEQSAFSPERREQLEARLKKEPQAPALYLELADLLVQEAQATQDPKLVMKAVDTLHTALSVDPAFHPAVLQLGRICLMFGVLDKATEYYERYIAAVPDDIEAQLDYGFALVQSSQTEKAITVLTRLLERKPELFPAHVTLALAYQQSGKQEQAEKSRELALQYAPDDAAKEKVREMFSSDRTVASRPAPKPENLSPATLVEQYFYEHKIIGPKLVRITWPSAFQARVEVRDFPVDAMPEFAKQQFLTKVKDHFKVLSGEFQISLVDANTSREFFLIPVGTK